MSSSRSPDDQPESSSEEPEKKKAGSPGRYSLADEGNDIPATRIDSTAVLPAVRAEIVAPKSRVELGRLKSPLSGGERLPKVPPVAKEVRKPSIGLPPPNLPPPTPGPNRAAPPPSVRGAAPPASVRGAAPPPSRVMPPESVRSRASAAKALAGAEVNVSRAVVPAPDPAKSTAKNPPNETTEDAVIKAEPAAAKAEPAAPKAEPAAPKAEPAAAKAEPSAPKAEPSAPKAEPALAKAEPAIAEAEPEQSGSLQAKNETLTTPRLPSRPPSRPPSIAPPGSRRVSSLRPPPLGSLAAKSIDSKSVSQPPSLPTMLEGFDEGSIAFAFDALVSDEATSKPGTHEFDLTPVRELFSELAANHMRHVRDFMIDVKWGEVTRDWIHICVPPVRTLRRAAERLELVELGQALEKLGVELDAANATGGQMLDAGEKERLLGAYGELVTILPQAFALDRDKSQREAVIVQALLLQVPDVRKVTIDKLHAAGLTALSVLFEANALDIAHVADVPHALASRIVDRVQAYRNELKTSSPQDARAAEREKLAALNATLKRHHDAYEVAANGWTPDDKTKKRDHFRAREETWLEISVLLARFGEVDRLQGIEKVPFAQRIAQLTDYLEEARDKYRAAEL